VIQRLFEELDPFGEALFECLSSDGFGRLQRTIEQLFDGGIGVLKPPRNQRPQERCPGDFPFAFDEPGFGSDLVGSFAENRL